MRVALIPVYVDYYGSIVPKLLKIKEELLRQVRNAISSEHEIIGFEKVTDTAEARSARDRLRRENPDCAIILPLVAAFSILTDELVKGWNKPLVLFSAMAGTMAPRPMTMLRVVGENQSFGSQAIANGWMRQGVHFHVLHQIPGTNAGNAAVHDLLRVIDTSVKARSLRIGTIGDVFSGMTDVLLPAERFQSQTGSQIVHISMKRIHDLMKSVTTRELLRLEAELRRVFEFGRFSPTEKEYSLRAASALQEIVRAEKLDCAAFNSHGVSGLKSKRLGLMCALGITLVTTRGCPIAEVGDLCTAFALWLGRQLSGASFYTELDSAYISAHKWLLLNSGEHDLAWMRRRSKPRLLRNAIFEGVNGRGASVCAPLRVGPATIINFTPIPGGGRPYRIQFCEGEITRDWHPEMGVGNAHFEIPGDARAVYERWLAAGPVHHSATCPGHLGTQLRLFCELQRWNCLQIA
jgi:L-arabinose isomerase